MPSVATESTAPVVEQNAGDQAEEQRQPRERRSRDRYGRDRRERGEGGEQGEKSESAAQAGAPATDSESNQASVQQERAQPATESIAQAAAVVAAPVLVAAAPVRAAQPVPTQAVAPVAASATGLPKVQSYDLPLQDLAQVAQSSGLQWVNSNAGKIAEAKEAMAAEARPVHVPRARPVVAVAEAAPLVLVETKRDLRDMPLPFEKSAD